MPMVKPGRRVTLNPDPKLGPVLVQLLQDGDIHAFVALGRLTQSAGRARVVVEGEDTVVIVMRGGGRRFVVPADVVKSA